MQKEEDTANQVLQHGHHHTTTISAILRHCREIRSRIPLSEGWMQFFIVILFFVVCILSGAGCALEDNEGDNEHDSARKQVLKLKEIVHWTHEDIGYELEVILRSSTERHEGVLAKTFEPSCVVLVEFCG